jgi:hypothetical protein
MKDLMENNLPESINRLKSKIHEDNVFFDEPEDLEQEIDFTHDAQKMKRQQMKDFIISEDEINNL